MLDQLIDLVAHLELLLLKRIDRALLDLDVLHQLILHLFEGLFGADFLFVHFLVETLDRLRLEAVHLLDKLCDILIGRVWLAHQAWDLKHVLHLYLELFKVSLLGGSCVIHLHAQILKIGRLLIDTSDLAIPDFQRALHALDLVLEACNGLSIGGDLTLKFVTDLVSVLFGALRSILILLVHHFKLVLRLVLHFALFVLKLHDLAVGALGVDDDGLGDTLLERNDALAGRADRRWDVVPLIVFDKDHEIIDKL